MEKDSRWGGRRVCSASKFIKLEILKALGNEKSLEGFKINKFSNCESFKAHNAIKASQVFVL